MSWKQQFVGAEESLLETFNTHQKHILAYLGMIEEVKEFKRWGVTKWGKSGRGMDFYLEMNLLS